MTSDTAIRVEGLGKKYAIGHQTANQSSTFRDALLLGFKNFTRMARAMSRGEPLVSGDELEEFWALDDINFDVKFGEVLGIIGHNGAGKSTLLKVLSRITEPSSGKVVLNGRIASLLEVGTGFHPELSGRENIFLNGAILGMQRSEIKAKFDEIVSFAEVERFLDTPVKRYSSGMYVRLAFAVAAHLEPEVLIVDEVLAVGDASFQKKCLGKMQSVAKGGRTVIFVSHNLPTVTSLCSRAILLSQGRVVADGTALAVARLYEQHRSKPADTEWKPIALENLTIQALNCQPSAKSGTRYKVQALLDFQEYTVVSGLALIISSSSGTRITVIDLRTALERGTDCQAKSLEVSVEVHALLLIEGTYRVDWFVQSTIFSGEISTDWQIDVTPSDQTLIEGAYEGQYRGYFELPSTFSAKAVNS